MIRSLYAHQAWADAALFTAVRKHDVAAKDKSLRDNLHHIVLVQRFFLSRFLDRPFDVQSELQQLPSLDDYEQQFREAHSDFLAIMNHLDPAELSRVIEHPYLPESHPTFAEALMQVVMHSQYHRGQCSARLRALGGEPPTTDFIVWISRRAQAIWA
jgi:uncharacterized damage-inducible protein DinB